LGHLEGALNLPLDQLADRLHELPTDRPLVLVCHTDRRSRAAAKLLHARGFRDLRIVRRGMTAWRDAERSCPDAG
ncbi:rhodanese-like domain-containing protein, partial [Thioalkalivibrio sp.]|uniref:rhodanese-like domain-containing protein n=1 Tax=Thioalkalivibrio sp. TaxID=2093813 RepID=UPI0012D675DF